MDLKIQHIAENVRGLFMKYGIRSVSMDDISRELAISKKTLYQYFQNKSDLIDKVLQVSHEVFEMKINAVMHEENNAIDDLLAMSLVFDEHMRNINPVVSFDLQKYYPEIQRKYLEKKYEFTSRYLKSNIVKGIRENIYRADLNIDLIANLYIRKIEDLHNPAYHLESQAPISDLFHVMFENHIRGIVNENGLKYFHERKEALKLEW